MAYPALIQKILELRKEVESSVQDRVELAAECLRISNRITSLELDRALGNGQSGKTTACCVCMSPEGHRLSERVKVAPVTLVSGDSNPPKNAALTLLLSDIIED